MEPSQIATRTFASATFVWLRSDRTRSESRAYWRGPHGALVASNPAFKEYRQHHFEPQSAIAWPVVEGVQTSIPDERRIDGMPEVTFRSALSILQSLRANSRIRSDEANVFSRTVLQLTAPGGGRWFRSQHTASVGARCVVLLQRRAGISRGQFAHFVHNELGQAFATIDGVLELRTLVFLPWLQALWNSPRVAHDYPASSRFHAAMIIGAADQRALVHVLRSHTAAVPLRTQSIHCSAIHAYAVAETYRLLPANR